MKHIYQIKGVDALHYEIHSRRWIGWIGNENLQKLIAKYFAWKTFRKYRRYANSLSRREQVIHKFYNQ